MSWKFEPRTSGKSNLEKVTEDFGIHSLFYFNIKSTYESSRNGPIKSHDFPEFHIRWTSADLERISDELNECTAALCNSTKQENSMLQIPFRIIAKLPS